MKAAPSKKSWRVLLVPALVSVTLMGGLHLYLSRTFVGRAIQAVARDPLALRLTATFHGPSWATVLGCPS